MRPGLAAPARQVFVAGHRHGCLLAIDAARAGLFADTNRQLP